MKDKKLSLPKPSRLRTHWALAPRTVFLNHGSFGACSKPILKLQTRFRQQMEAEPVQFLWRHYDEHLDVARKALARFLGARPRDLVFVNNATTAINAVARSYPLRPGDEVLTTSHDYNACRNVLREVVRRAGASLVVARMPFPVSSPAEVVDAVMRSVTRRTRLAMIDHVTSDTALVYPIEQLVRKLEQHGIDVLVDGAHAPGMVPLNISKLCPAFYTGNLHKWVCAPKGAAFLWVREERQGEIQPAVVSHGNNRSRPGHTPFQDRFDWAGTVDPSPWFCVAETLLWMDGLLPEGWPEVRRRNRDLAIQARRLLCRELSIEPPCPESMLGSMATLPLPESFQTVPRNGKIDREQLQLYDRYKIEVPFSRFGEPERRWFRISAQLHNTLADYQYLADCLRRL